MPPYSAEDNNHVRWQGGYEGPFNSFYKGLGQTDFTTTQHNKGKSIET